ncbi:hypothetical protein [uncultured Ilyobacter sp.]|uniref:hypothetical protein n=1 Tax=uncultured Ilyobacter sp. TaxID=544433 RepID=UPI0029BFCD3B|nr:hypothetical protein [uncultured Ilyobacter sp.]
MMEKFSLSVSVYSKKIRIIHYLFLLLFFMNLLSIFFKYILGHPHVYGFVPLFDFDSENNIPTYFSSIILLISAVLLKIIAIFKKSISDDFHLNWSVLSFIFLWMSVDESSKIHELLSEPIKNLFDLPRIFNYAWVILGTLFILILFIFYYKFLLNLPKKTMFYFVVAGLVFVTGAIGVETISGYYRYVSVEKDFIYTIMITIEESFEMLGVIIFINGLFQYAEDNISRIKLKFEP